MTGLVIIMVTVTSDLGFEDDVKKYIVGKDIEKDVEYVDINSLTSRR